MRTSNNKAPAQVRTGHQTTHERPQCADTWAPPERDPGGERLSARVQRTGPGGVGPSAHAAGFGLGQAQRRRWLAAHAKPDFRCTPAWLLPWSGGAATARLPTRPQQLELELKLKLKLRLAGQGCQTGLPDRAGARSSLLCCTAPVDASGVSVGDGGCQWVPVDVSGCECSPAPTASSAATWLARDGPVASAACGPPRRPTRTCPSAKCSTDS